MVNVNNDRKSATEKACSLMQDSISCADITDLRRIDNILDDLKSMIEDHVMALAGHGGD